MKLQKAVVIIWSQFGALHSSKPFKAFPLLKEILDILFVIVHIHFAFQDSSNICTSFVPLCTGQ